MRIAVFERGINVPSFFDVVVLNNLKVKYDLNCPVIARNVYTDATVLHFDYDKKWNIDKNTNIPVVINFYIDKEEDIKIIYRYTYVCVKNFYIALRYVNKSLREDVKYLLEHDISRQFNIWLYDAHMDYLNERRVECSCLVYKTKILYCPYKEKQIDDIYYYCDKCDMLDAYEYKYLSN